MQSSISLKLRKEKGLQRFLNQIKALPEVTYYLFSTFSISFLSEIIVGYTMIYTLGFNTFKAPVITTLYTALAYILAFIMLAILPSLILKNHDPKKKLNPIQKLINLWKIDKETLGIIDLPTTLDILLSLLAFFLYIIVSGFILDLFKNFPWFQVNQAQDVGFSRYLVGLDRIFAFISLVILAPIFEELIFRGWLYGKIRKKVSLLPAILIVSILFGCMHGQWNVGVNVFVLSLFLCGLREFTGTIYASILLHMIKNGLAFYFMYVLGF